jgi:hypothetical protein
MFIHQKNFNFYIFTFIYEYDEPNDDSQINTPEIVKEAVNKIETKVNHQNCDSLKKKHVSINPVPLISYFDNDQYGFEDQQEKKLVKKIFNEIDEFITLEQAKKRLEQLVEKFHFNFR